MTRPRLTLSGYYGFGNAGDEAVLAGLVQSLYARRDPSELDVVVLSINPPETRHTHGTRAAHRYRARELLRALARTDVLLSGGGSLLQDVTSAHGIFYYLAVVRIAQMLGKRTMFVAQGVGPLKRARSRRLVAAVANRLDALTVRDPASADLLREIGVRRDVEVTADPALLLRPSPSFSPLPSEGEGPGGRVAHAFGVALRPWPGDGALAFHVAEACRHALPEGRALLFPMQPAADRAPADQFAQHWSRVGSTVLCSTETGLPALLHNLDACRMVVGMRLHALILAAACGVPSVALSYDPKVAAFMAQSGQADAVYELAADDPEALTGLLARVWHARDERASALRQRLPALRAAAERNAEVALSLLPA